LHLARATVFHGCVLNIEADPKAIDRNVSLDGRAIPLIGPRRSTICAMNRNLNGPVPEPDVKAAWSEEIKRRLTEIDAGTVELTSWEESGWNCSTLRHVPKICTYDST
jgi:hypothetical protein